MPTPPKSYPCISLGVECNSLKDWEVAHSQWKARRRRTPEGARKLRESNVKYVTKLMKDDPDKYADKILGFLNAVKAQ